MADTRRWKGRPGGRLIAFLAVAPLAALLLSAAPPDPGLSALVAKVVEASGGRAALEKYPVVVQEGEVAAHEAADVGRLTRIYGHGETGGR